MRTRSDLCAFLLVPQLIWVLSCNTSKQLPEERIATVIARAECDYLARCDPDRLDAFAGGSLAACVDYFTCGALRRFRRIPGSASRVDPTACVQWLDGKTCQPSLEGSRLNYELALLGGSPCWPLPPPTDAPGPGERCVQRVRGGEQAVCSQGAWCAFDMPVTMVGFSICGRCRPLVPHDGDCSDGAPCTPPDRCIAGTCGLPLVDGSSCRASWECASGDCQTGSCITPPPRPPRAAVLGSTCDEFNWEPCQGVPSLTCIGGHCQLRPDEGDPCSRTGNRPACREGQVCAEGRCVAVGCSAEVGEPCESSCDEGICNLTTGRCDPWPGPGEPCTVLCRTGLTCKAERCAARRADGAPCGRDTDCTSNFCLADFSASCTVTPPRGFSCTGDGCPADCGVCAPPPTARDCP